MPSSSVAKRWRRQAVTFWLLTAPLVLGFAVMLERVLW